jgi:putative transposase
VEDLLAARDLDISYETVSRWFLKLGLYIGHNLRRMRPTPSDYCHLDEMVVVILGRRLWLWRAVDNEGEVLDFLVQSKQSAKAALKVCAEISEETRVRASLVYHWQAKIPSCRISYAPPDC